MIFHGKYCELLYNSRNTIMPVFPGFHKKFKYHNIVHIIVQLQFADAGAPGRSAAQRASLRLSDISAEFPAALTGPGPCTHD